MGAVAVAVLGRVVVVDGVETVGGSAAEVLVRLADAGVDDVSRNALAGLVRVGVALVQRERLLVDPVQAPGGRVGLGRVDGEDAVLYDRLDGGVGGELLGLRLGDLNGVAVEGGAVGPVDPRAVPLGDCLAAVGGGAGGRVVQGHDVAAGDGAGGAGILDDALRGGRGGCRGG